MLVTVINRTNDLALVGDRYLFPGEGRLVPAHVYEEARDRYGAGLVAHGGLGALDPAVALELDEDGPEPLEFSLDALDGAVDATAADLERLTRAELAEAARLHGIVPGRMTRRDLIAAIRACDEE